MSKIKMTKEQFLTEVVIRDPCPEGLARLKRELKKGTLLNVLKRYRRSELARQGMQRRYAQWRAANPGRPVPARFSLYTRSGDHKSAYILGADWRWLANYRSANTPLSKFLLSQGLVWLFGDSTVTTTTKPE